MCQHITNLFFYEAVAHPWKTKSNKATVLKHKTPVQLDFEHKQTLSFSFGFIFSFETISSYYKSIENNTAFVLC